MKKCFKLSLLVLLLTLSLTFTACTKEEPGIICTVGLFEYDIDMDIVKNHFFEEQNIPYEEFDLNSDYFINYIIYPQDKNSSLAIYSTTLTDEGEIVKDKLLHEVGEKGAVGKMYDFEYVPNTIFEITTKDGKVYDVMPNFSGEDGRVVYGDMEGLVDDVSTY